MNCLICGNQLYIMSYVSLCINDHMICKSCFSMQDRSQILKKHECEIMGEMISEMIMCSYCETPFIENIDDTTFKELTKIKNDFSIFSIFSIFNIFNIFNTKKSNVLKPHKLYDCKTCNTTILDFEGCFEIRCYMCNSQICGWCLKTFKYDSSNSYNVYNACNKYIHLRTCKYFSNKSNLNKSKSYETKVKVKEKKYINKIDDQNLKKELIDKNN